MEVENGFFPITELPDEIIAIVFYWVNIVDLWALACVCRRFRDISKDRALNLLFRVSKRNAITTIETERTARIFADGLRMVTHITCTACKKRFDAIDCSKPPCIYTCDICKLMLCSNIFQCYFPSTQYRGKPFENFGISKLVSPSSEYCEECYQPFNCESCDRYCSHRLDTPVKCQGCNELICKRCIEHKFDDHQTIEDCRLCGEKTCDHCYIAFECKLLGINKFGNLEGPYGIVFRREQFKADAGVWQFESKMFPCYMERTRLVAIGIQNYESAANGIKSLIPLTKETFERLTNTERDVVSTKDIVADYTIVRSKQRKRKNRLHKLALEPNDRFSI